MKYKLEIKRLALSTVQHLLFLSLLFLWPSNSDAQAFLPGDDSSVTIFI